MRLPLFPLLIALVASVAHAGDGHTTDELPAYHVSAPRAAVVTEKNLLASELFWPYQVELRDGSSGVLIRVEASGVARIDFGRDGLRDVPVADTDLLVRANRIRSGELDKMAPNFVFAIGPRLADSAGPAPKSVPFPITAAKRGFLCVYADPSAPGFAEMAAALAPLADRHGVMTILFPQGQHPDLALREQLRAAHWPVPFVYDHMSEAYTRTLLPAGVAPPAIMLVSPEGRLTYVSAWKPSAVPKLVAALDGAFEIVTGP